MRNQKLFLLLLPLGMACTTPAPAASGAACTLPGEWSFSIRGGFAGFHDDITVKDARFSLDRDGARCQAAISCASVARLSAQLSDADVAAALKKHSDFSSPGTADELLVTVRHGADQFSVSDAGNPPAGVSALESAIHQLAAEEARAGCDPQPHR